MLKGKVVSILLWVSTFMAMSTSPIGILGGLLILLNMSKGEVGTILSLLAYHRSAENLAFTLFCIFFPLAVWLYWKYEAPRKNEVVETAAAIGFIPALMLFWILEGGAFYP